MKRDMDLARKILFEIESQPSADNLIDLKFDGYSDEEIPYHVMLLDEANLIEADEVAELGAQSHWFPIRLTWQGHEFLDAARDDTRWNKTKDAMAKAGGFVFDVAKLLLIEFMKQQLFPPNLSH
jgi:hypothetical protein